MRLLVVEDEPKTAEYVQKGLSENGYVVDTATNGVDGLHLALTADYDAVILDVMLPKMDGWQVIRELRKRKSTPVLFLSARGKVADRVTGLELGADDYLPKPLAFSELLARVRTLLRRGPEREPDTLHVGDLELDTRTRRVTRGAKTIHLTAKEFALLHLLMRRQGEVLSRTLIAEQVWDMNFESDTNVVEVAIRRLRGKVDDPYPVKLIHTLRGVGFPRRGIRQFLPGRAGVAVALKESTPEAIRALRQSRVRIVMLTGDSQRTADAVARQLGIDVAIGEVLPKDKATHVQRLQSEGRTVAMAGDAINDAPALAQADVGIAMGTGTHVAMDSASVMLVKGDLRGIARAAALSRATMRNIRQNLLFAFGYNALGIPIAAGVLYPAFGLLLSPIFAGAAMPLSSVSVVTNALRLRRARLGAA